MKILIKFAVVSIAFVLPAIAIACEYPERPDLPDGSSAAKDDMIAAQKAVKEFLANVDGYLICIEKEEKTAVDEMDLDPENEEDQDAEVEEAAEANDPEEVAEDQDDDQNEDEDAEQDFVPEPVDQEQEAQ